CHAWPGSIVFVDERVIIGLFMIRQTEGPMLLIVDGLAGAYGKDHRSARSPQLRGARSQVSTLGAYVIDQDIRQIGVDTVSPHKIRIELFWIARAAGTG